MTKLANGELRRLGPLNWTTNPWYDLNHDKIPDCPTCTNGIVTGSTALIPTN